MKVIFIRDLKGQGKKGEVKEVKDGYGNNFLIKNGYAVLASSGNMTHNARKHRRIRTDKDPVPGRRQTRLRATCQDKPANPYLPPREPNDYEYLAPYSPHDIAGYMAPTAQSQAWGPDRRGTHDQYRN